MASENRVTRALTPYGEREPVDAGLRLPLEHLVLQQLVRGAAVALDLFVHLRRASTTIVGGDVAEHMQAVARGGRDDGAVARIDRAAGSVSRIHDDQRTGPERWRST